MSKVWVVPMEQFESRFTTQWLKWLLIAFTEHDLKPTVIDGVLLDTEIESSRWSHFFGNQFFKSSQLQALITKIWKGEIKDGDVLFFFDLWFPGIEALALLRQLCGIDFKIVGILHSGLWNPWHAYSIKGCASWGEPMENSWLNLADAICVGTQYHKDAIVAKRKVEADKIRVTGLPFNSKEIAQHGFGIDKKNQVVFPHRLEYDKQPQLFETMITRAKNHPSLAHVSFVKTWDQVKSKEEYYRILAESKIAISFAWQETFGIAMLEACALGCVPLVPDRLAYSEIYPGACLFDSEASVDEVLFRINALLKSPYDLSELRRSTQTIPTQFYQSADRIAAVVTGMMWQGTVDNAFQKPNKLEQ